MRELDGQPCRVTEDHRRERKTGPGFPLTVCRCLGHQKGFTIYPLGYVPYARKALAPVTPEGTLIDKKEEDHRFSETIFDAALDAARGQFWPQQSTEDLSLVYPTQIRHLHRACLLLGLDPGLDEKVREQIIRELELPGQVVHDRLAGLRDMPFSQKIGQTVRDLLDALPATRLFDRLANTGAYAGLWPLPQYWDNSIKNYRKEVFRIAGTRSPPK